MVFIKVLEVICILIFAACIISCSDIVVKFQKKIIKANKSDSGSISS